MCDLISRQAAIKAVMVKPALHGPDGSWYHSSDIKQALHDLPSASSEITKCKDCKYKKDRHYEEPGEEPYIKSTCENKYGLAKGYQVHDWEFCSRAVRGKYEEA